MIARASKRTPAQVRELVQSWYDRQVAVISQAFGDKWPEHQDWVEDYLREEVRALLIAKGWRPKK